MPLTSIDAERPDPAYSQQLCTLLEDGHLLLLVETPFLPGPAGRALLCGTAKSGGRAHKNIAYRPHSRQLTGADTADAEEALLLQETLADYSERALTFLARLLPRYAAHWKVEYASFRPEEEAGRSLPLKRRNDLLHVDAFPTRPTHGGRILRVFTNLHSERDRVWAVSPPVSGAGRAVCPLCGAAARPRPPAASPALGLRGGPCFRTSRTACLGLR